jgi:DNA-binding PadR family transcriptional regulator
MSRRSEVSKRATQIIAMLEREPEATYIDFICELRTSTTGVYQALRMLERNGALDVIRRYGQRNIYIPHVTQPALIQQAPDA